MPRVKKLKVHMKDLQSIFYDLHTQGYNHVRIFFPVLDPKVSWVEHIADVRAWRAKT